MTDKLEMPIEQFAEAVAKENARLNTRIEKLEAALRNVTTAWDRWQKISDSNSFTELFASICEAKVLEGKDG